MLWSSVAAASSLRVASAATFRRCLSLGAAASQQQQRLGPHPGALCAEGARVRQQEEERRRKVGRRRRQGPGGAQQGTRQGQLVVGSETAVLFLVFLRDQNGQAVGDNHHSFEGQDSKEEPSFRARYPAKPT